MEENKVTIPLSRYDELKEAEFMLEDISREFEIIIKKTTTLNWNKTELDIQEYLIPLLKKYNSNTYTIQLEKVKENDK